MMKDFLNHNLDNLLFFLKIINIIIFKLLKNWNQCYQRFLGQFSDYCIWKYGINLKQGE